METIISFNYKDTCKDNEKEKFLHYIRNNIIGENTVFDSPYGKRKVVYCDYFASGRSLQFIEDFIINVILPHYGSTHSTSTVNALQTALYRQEARDIIRNAVRASEHDCILFVGSGSTGAINKLINGLDFDVPPIVITDSLAHHSSLLPWKEINAKVVTIREEQNGSLDMVELEECLIKHQHMGRPIVGCFAAASNITGVIADSVEITRVLHKYGALSFWDYASAAPYIALDMNPIIIGDASNSAFKDAMFFSMHKFLGGVQTPGILVAKKYLFRNNTPLECGGGTVFFVSRTSHCYRKNLEEREEGGTPAIVESIRAGMVMQLKETVGADYIMKVHESFLRKIVDFSQKAVGFISLGNVKFEKRLPVISFIVHNKGSGYFLHHNFISAVLNDVYGIQARGGCACAGPYAQDLLGIDESLALEYEKVLLEHPCLDREHLRRHEEHSDLEILRPGFVRLNIPFTASEELVNFILQAVSDVCQFSWLLLPQYNFNAQTGIWKHHQSLFTKTRLWLQYISYENGEFLYSQPQRNDISDFDYTRCLKEAAAIYNDAYKAARKRTVSEDTLVFSENTQHLRWFLLPSEARHIILKDAITSVFPVTVPFFPPSYPLMKEEIYKRPSIVSGFLHKSYAFKNDTNSEKCLLKNGKADDTKIEVRSDVKGKNLCLWLKDFKTVSPCTKILTKSGGWCVPPKHVFRLMTEAINIFKMINDGDKVLVCLSGGKDSLSLLHFLRQYQHYAKASNVNFEIGAATVNPLTSSYDPTPLIPYLKFLGVHYLFETQCIMEQAQKTEGLKSICSFCSRMKRGRLYAAARREGYNVLALGQHLDDLAESFMMSVFHNGRLRTMKSNYSVSEGDLRVIRPFVFVREKDLRNFAEINALPVIPENCPGCFESPKVCFLKLFDMLFLFFLTKERHRVKQILAQQEILFSKLFWSIRTALHPLMAISFTGLENVVFGKSSTLLQNLSATDED